MNTYTYSEARQKLAALLNKAKKEGKVLIKRKDGTVFEVKALTGESSPLDVKGVNAKLQREEIIDVLREVRERE
jgi:hypothetical protein